MQLLFDFFPIFLFFIAYKFFGIFNATAVAILASGAQLAWVWHKKRRLEMTYVITFVLILFLGGATLLFHNDMFIKWKPTAIYWALGLLFLGSNYVGERPVLQRLLSDKLTLPDDVWRRLSIGWAMFFLVVGVVNLFVVYNFSTNAWVNFKLFGVLGLTFVFGLLQSMYVAKYLGDELKDKL
ncbi:MAG: septation protein A [Gammaproteobacteria bacterium]